MKILELIHDEDHPQMSNIDRWISDNPGFETSKISAYCDFEVPDFDSYDLVIVHGGAQHLWDKDTDPWLYYEIDFLSDVIKMGKPVIGFCLGSQIIAEILGARVFEMSDKEIGWFGITLKSEYRSDCLVKDIGDKFDTFLWHSDHYELPDNCVSLGSTVAAEHQIFYSQEYPVVGFQFHPEYSKQLIQHYFETFYDECWIGGKYVARKEGFIEDLTQRDDTYNLFRSLMNNTLKHFQTKFKIIL